MFENKKTLKKIEKEKEELLAIKEEIELAKNEMKFIEENLENKSQKINISNLYVWNENDIMRIVRLCDVSGSIYKKNLVDIFSNEIMYQEENRFFNNNIFLSNVRKCEKIKLDVYNYAYITPICHVEPALLAFPDKQVPIYVLQRVYYKLNKVDVKSPLIKK